MITIISQVSLYQLQMTAILPITNHREAMLSSPPMDSKVMGSKHLDHKVLGSLVLVSSRMGKPMVNNHMARQGPCSKVMGSLHLLLHLLLLVIHSKAMDSKVYLHQGMGSNHCHLNKAPPNLGIRIKDHHSRLLDSKGLLSLAITSRVQHSQQALASK